MVPSGNENSERESNPMLQPLYLRLSGLAFLVNFTGQNNQLSNVKPVAKYFGQQSNVYIDLPCPSGHYYYYYYYLLNSVL